jgi:putative two-component system response regulator
MGDDRMSIDSAFRILVVDDEPANVRLLERLLRSNGHANTTSTTDAREVERLCDEIDPDLILLDLHMPAMDGFTLLQRLRERLDAST